MASDPTLTAVVEKILRQQAQLATKNNVGDLCQQLLQQLLALSSANGGALYLLNESRDKLLRQSQCQVNDLHAPTVIELTAVPRKESPEPIVDCVQRGVTVNIDSIYSWSGYNCDSLYRADQFALAETPSRNSKSKNAGQRTQSVLVLPLQASNEILGAVMLRSLVADQPDIATDDRADFPTAVRSLADAYASQASIFIANHQLQQQNQALLAAANAKNATLSADNKTLRQREKLARHHLIMGSSEVMRKATDKVFKVATANATVLLQGETGVGKEVFARLLHQQSNRADKPLIIQNCAALPANLLEAELFGYRKGAFTGAERHYPGLFRSANGGTLFLDEVGELPLALQAKLLRVIQEQAVRPLGEAEEQSIDIRLVAATHKNLKAAVAAGEFREDLYYRLNVYPIFIPALRERPEDIPELAEHFIAQLGSEPLKLNPDANAQLQQHSWPGNVRELRHCVERLLLSTLGNTTINSTHVFEALEQHHSPPHAPQTSGIEHGSAETPLNGDLRSTLKDIERRLITNALQHCHDDTDEAAQQLGLPVRTLRTKIQKLNVPRKYRQPRSC